MMTNFLLASGFSLVAVASTFMIYLWSSVALDKSHTVDHRLSVAAWSLTIINIGVAGMSANRMLEELGTPGFHDPILYVILIIAVVGAIGLMSSSAIEGHKHMVGAFAGLAILAVIVCAVIVF